MKRFASMLLALAFAEAVQAQYPVKPVRIVVPYPPGGTVDVVARNLAQQLTVQTGQQFIVDNRAPAGTLQPNSNYLSRVGFFHYVGATNASYATAAYRATYTEFSLTTTGIGQLVLTNASWTPGVFSFDVLCTNGQTVTVEYTNVLTAVNWTKLLTTNSPGTQFHVVSPQATWYPSLFYRARNGP